MDQINPDPEYTGKQYVNQKQPAFTIFLSHIYEAIFPKYRIFKKKVPSRKSDKKYQKI